VLFIWTDCDREGEHIGSEIRDIARAANPRIQVKRAHFSNIERALVDFCPISHVRWVLTKNRHIIQAANNPVDLDERQAQAVEARIELDLRVGASFTRILTTTLKPMILPVQPDLKVISYGDFHPMQQIIYIFS
jgi:DNA topoisomerase III